MKEVSGVGLESWVWGFICNLEVVCPAPPVGEVMSNRPHRSLNKDSKDGKVLHNPYFHVHQTNLTKGVCSTLQITVSYMSPLPKGDVRVSLS